MNDEFEYENDKEGDWPVDPEHEDDDYGDPGFGQHSLGEHGLGEQSLGEQGYEDEPWDPSAAWKNAADPSGSATGPAADGAAPADRTEVLITQGRVSAHTGPLAAVRGATSHRAQSGTHRISGSHRVLAHRGQVAGQGSGSRPSGAVLVGVLPDGDAPHPKGGADSDVGRGGPGRPAARGGYGEPGTPVKPLKAGRRGRQAGNRKVSKPKLIAIGAGALALGIALVVLLQGPGPGWPVSVATVKQEITVACQNPDVASDPGQVNFACGKDTSQVLWVFALLTSGDNPGFTDSATGRTGLEPIGSVQGGEVAWSLNLHHPYNAGDPVDSLEVAARAINNIIGGATVTGQNGTQVVQPGLESSSANCAKYTGSAALVTRQGYPALCARPVTTAGEPALVADVYQQWMVGAPPRDAQDAALLFANAANPGNSQVQAILHTLAAS